jgi:hypothetical protein
VSPTSCSCPHTATRNGMIRNGRDNKCPIHGDPVEASPLMGEPEIVDDATLNTLLNGVRTINRLHVQDKRFDYSVERGRSGKHIFEYMQLVIEDLQRQRSIIAAAVEAKTP